MIGAWLRLSLVCAPAIFSMIATEGALAWYVSSAALVVALLWELQRGQKLVDRIPCWVGMLIYSVAAIYGLADESGAASAAALWLLLAVIAIGAEAIHQWGVQSWPSK